MKLPLFPAAKDTNLLPYDGEVYYYENVFTQASAQQHFRALLEHIAWKNDEAYFFGKQFITKRKVAWYADRPFSYTYSNITKSALPWTNDLLALKRTTEEVGLEKFNSCLLNLYHSGEEGMSWHSDDEKALGKSTTIASLSFGAARKFSFKHKKTNYRVSFLLEPGSILFMKGSTQQHWLHRLPPTKKVKTERINLTFRQMLW